jgi:hypothetical protein
MMVIVPPDKTPVSKAAVAVVSLHTYTPLLMVMVVLNVPVPEYPAAINAVRRLYFNVFAEIVRL